MQDISNFSKITQDMELGLNPDSDMAKLISESLSSASSQANTLKTAKFRDIGYLNYFIAFYVYYLTQSLYNPVSLSRGRK